MTNCIKSEQFYMKEKHKNCIKVNLWSKGCSYVWMTYNLIGYNKNVIFVWINDYDIPY